MGPHNIRKINLVKWHECASSFIYEALDLNFFFYFMYFSPSSEIDYFSQVLSIRSHTRTCTEEKSRRKRWQQQSADGQDHPYYVNLNPCWIINNYVVLSLLQVRTHVSLVFHGTKIMRQTWDISYSICPYHSTPPHHAHKKRNFFYARLLHFFFPSRKILDSRWDCELTGLHSSPGRVKREKSTWLGASSLFSIVRLC